MRPLSPFRPGRLLSAALLSCLLAFTSPSLFGRDTASRPGSAPAIGGVGAIGAAAAKEPEKDSKDAKKGPKDSKGGKKDDKKKGDDKDKKDEKKWDVDNPPGPTSSFTLDVDEGTWMSVDVSPDGQEIAFDLLGDIYTMPATGGEAKLLTKDISWQEHPRYSPDGKWIAFTSDQGGGDNIWVMKRDGKDEKQVTKESFRLLNSPAWTPDGDYIVARKHFTAQRSAGAGEMWLYHRSGGGGLQLTKKPNDQKDAGEPVFSPDGRYLYYSQDTTPGATFQYNKDPNTQIYVIQRLDRQTGETEEYVSGPGGSIRPTPSPDGKSLAFIRRVRGKSTIFVKDLASGDERPIYDGLDRDMQETWAIHGVYPSMAWTPDNRALVFWAGGKIRRLEVLTKTAAVIPFHVHNVKKVSAPVRFPVDVAPKTFNTKMLRWVEVSPAGDKVVFQALGYLWIRDLGGAKPGEARRLTNQTQAWELYPSFSRDGKQIVYTTWNDDSFGSLRVVPVEGGEGRAVLAKPGQYVSPVFSPDGSQIVYQKIAGGFVRTPLWSSEPGIYKVPAAGGEPVLVTKNGFAPHFGAENDRVYLSRGTDDNKAKLSSIGLDGKEERDHLTSEKAIEFKVSPDGKWVAFTELFNAYIVPFVPTGKAVDVSPSTSSIPLRKATRDAGEYLHWSGDSKKLHWTLGPELYTQDLKEAFAFVDGAPEKLPDPPTKGLDLGFPVVADAPSGVVAVVGGKVVTMKGAGREQDVIENGTVLIEGNRIKAVGPASQVTVPPGAYVVDATGKTVVPGLIDVHWHGTFGTDGIVPQRNWVTYATLGFGVTTLHDPSNDTDTIFAAAEMARAGLITAPRIFSTGTILYGADINVTAKIDSLEDARGHLRRMKAAGAFSVKSYNQPRREQRQQVIAAARELGMMVVPEGGSLFQHNMSMVVDGHTTVEHSIPVPAIYNDVRQLWKSTPVAYTPTLIVGYGGIWGENYWYDKTHVWEDKRLLSFVPREIVDPRSRRRVTAPDEEYGHFKNAAIATELSRLGVGVNVGAHGQREGLGAHWEMWMLNQGGSTPWEALRDATITGARSLGLDKDLGSLEPGKLADVVVMDGDVLTDLRKSTHIGQVILNGRVYDSTTLNQLYPEKRTRQPFFWEKTQQIFSPQATGLGHGPVEEQD